MNYTFYTTEYGFIGPFDLTIEKECIGYTEGFVVSEKEFSECGVGETIKDALDDFIESFVEYYEQMKKRSDCLVLVGRLLKYINFEPKVQL